MWKADEIVALIGPNGAGKTTFFNCITGIYNPTAGNIFITPPGKKHQRINGLKVHQVTERGMARTFQNIRLFHDMTVLENVMVARHCRSRPALPGPSFATGPPVKKKRPLSIKAMKSCR